MSGFQLLLIVAGIAVVFGLLMLWMRSMMRKLKELWAPNTQLVNGTFSRFRAKLTGTYQNRPVMVYLGNQDVEEKIYSYNLRMTLPTGFENWALACVVPRKGEPPAWTLKAKPGATEQLTSAGLLTEVASIPGNWQLRYRASNGGLQLSIVGVGMYFCPDVATFQAQLDLLVRIAAITLAAAGTPLRAAA
jgi:hypothetical protein